MEETNTEVRSIIFRLVASMESQSVKPWHQQYELLEKEIFCQFSPLLARSDKLLMEIKQELFNPDLENPYKYPVIMYVSLLCAQNDHSCSLLSFYYQFASKALKDLKKGKKGGREFWETLFQKIYQFGILLLSGNRTLLLSMETLATRVNSQVLAQRAKETKMSKLIRVYNCILNIPEEYVSVKEILSLTLIFARWETCQEDSFSASFFAAFQKKTQSKLISKLNRYPRRHFTQELLLSLIKIVLSGEDLLFSYFLEAKFLYESSKSSNSNGKEQPALEGIRKADILTQGKQLFNLIVKFLLQAPQESLRLLERESIIHMAIKTLSGKFENNEELFQILALRYIEERNEFVCQTMYRFIREEVLAFLTVYKLKLLLNVFNRTTWSSILNQFITPTVLIDRLAKIIELLTALACRYSDEDLNLRCLPHHCGLAITNVREVKSLAFVVVFQQLGRLSQPQNLDYCLLKLKLDKGEFQLMISFVENSEMVSVEGKKESRERTAFITIRRDSKEMLKQKKQYLRFGEGNFESLVTATLKGKDCKSLQLSIDGAFYELTLDRKSEIRAFQVGHCYGTIRSFYALNCELEVIEFHKKWCERERKVRSVVEELGIDKYCFKTNHHQSPPIIQFEESKWSFFNSKTEIAVLSATKGPKMLDIYLQLGGLQTIFFVLERLSRCLQELKEASQKVVELFRCFFEMLRVTAVMDESYQFLDDILLNFKLLNPFLFLLIKRNHFVRETHDSRLLLSIFELILYFRKDREKGTAKPQLQLKMQQIQVKLVINTLANFEIWSNCSLPLQRFILTLIDSFLRNANQTLQLIDHDLHREILSAVVLFATSEFKLANSEEVQRSLSELGLTLYSTILKLYDSAAAIRELTQKKALSESFIQRDLNLSLCLLRSLSHRSMGRSLSESEVCAFGNLVRYLKRCFLGSDILFKVVSNWNEVMWIVCRVAGKEVSLEVGLVCLLSELILNFISRCLDCDWWIIGLVKEYADNSRSSFLDCLKLVACIADKYNFVSPNKSTVFQHIIQLLIQKQATVDPDLSDSPIDDLELALTAVSLKGLFRLTCQHTFLNLMELLRDTYFNTQQQLKRWRLLTRSLLHSLLQQSFVHSSNAPFIQFLLHNIYLKDADHPLATHFHFSSERIAMVKELAKYQKPISLESLASNLQSGAYALIEHCRGWVTLYYLLQEGLLLGEGDVPLPFSPTDLESKQCPGGVISFYLAGKCSPLELYLLLNVILYRQLGNKITFLSTVAPTAIYQKTLENLVEVSGKKEEFEGSWHLLGTLLKEVVMSLNGGYLIKGGTVWKDVEKQLGTDKPRKKASLLELLITASRTVEQALEDSKIDKDLLAFKELVQNKLKLINQDNNLPSAIDQGSSHSNYITQLLELAQEIKKFTPSPFHKLNLLGSRFLQVARDYWLGANPSNQIAEPPSEKMMELQLFSQSYEVYERQLDEQYQKVLGYFNEKGLQSEKEWKNLLVSNQHWFQLQGALDDLTTKFYQLDEKLVGPFGFYQLNIKPLRTDLDKIPYPRRNQYKELILEKQSEQKGRDLYLTITSSPQKETSTFFESFSEASREDLLRAQGEQSQVDEDEKSEGEEYWCEWVTKQGVYGGKLSKKGKEVCFRFTGHTEMPEEPVYRISTNKCHWIQTLNDWQKEEISKATIPFCQSEIFTRRYILRHTAFEIFSERKHRSYFFNLFHPEALSRFLQAFRGEDVDLILNRQEEFARRKFTERWKKGEFSNFEYLCLVNRYSGRSTNDLAQYPVMPWVIVNFDGKDNYTEITKEFLKNDKNLRDLTVPTGKLSAEKFKKLKMRLNQIDPNDVEIRFLYGTMYSNPTILYNFFIRLEPFTSLHWEHQGRKLDHADRLFSGINEQFSTVLSSSSDNKELTPQFYYWPEFLKNRNQIELGRKQKGEEVHSVVLPVWAHTPEEFVFKMREVLESQQVSEKLHSWIDLVFGCKAPYHVAEEHDNLYHYQCYEHDIFASYDTEARIRTAQIVISEFGQVPETLFEKEHPRRQTRRHIDIDQGVSIFKPGKDFVPTDFDLNDAGIMLWSEKQVLFKKTSIPGLYSNFEWAREFQSQGNCYLLSINLNSWLSLAGGTACLHEKKKVKWEYLLDSKCLSIVRDYIFSGVGSKIEIIKSVGQQFQPVKSLYAHHSEVVFIQIEPVLDLILSVDKTGLVLLHELTELKFFRAFSLGVEIEGGGGEAVKLKVCVHLMGYFIFLDHQQTLHVFNFLGEKLLEQELEVRVADHRSEEELITDIELMSHEEPLVLASSSKGNIFVLNWLEIIRFREIYPFKNYSRMSHNLVGGVKKRPNSRIVKFKMVHSRATSNILYQLVVLYEDGEVICFCENSEMAKQLQSLTRLKSMGFV